jgi:nucleotide-binding universal stress UspA family protein
LRPDLIVMGKHGRTWMEELIVGSVTRDTIDCTKCDIIVTPPPGGRVSRRAGHDISQPA